MSNQTNTIQNKPNMRFGGNLHEKVNTREVVFSRSLVADEDPEPPEIIDKSERFINEL